VDEVRRLAETEVVWLDAEDVVHQHVSIRSAPLPDIGGFARGIFRIIRRFPYDLRSRPSRAIQFH
jgi:hypothetical protein